MKIAVVGTGISGLSAAWLLNQRHDITVFEADSRLGGHSNTVVTPEGVPVDTGFIVYNTPTYPNLTALFEHLAVPTKASDMSFGVSLGGGHLEYCGDSLATLFAQKRNIVSPKFLKMLKDITRFYKQAPVFLENASVGSPESHLSLGTFLQQNQYSDGFIRNHLLPMGAAIWSMPWEQVLAFPAVTFLRFFQNHGLLSVSPKGRKAWRTVHGGSMEYVHRLTQSFSDKIRLNTAVRSILREKDTVFIKDSTGQLSSFDHVVLACHADQALGLLANPTRYEAQILGSFKYSQNRAILHKDTRFMPRRQKAWASWNYIGSNAPEDASPESSGVSLTYWMNRLQKIDPSYPLFVTLNPQSEPDPALVLYEAQYTHPIFNLETDEAQTHLCEIQGKVNTWFCGSYCGYGFHEDGISSGLAVAEALGGIKRPWSIRESSPAGTNATPIMHLVQAAA